MISKKLNSQRWKDTLFTILNYYQTLMPSEVWSVQSGFDFFIVIYLNLEEISK